MTKKKVTYRVFNFYANIPRVGVGAFIHPDLADMIIEQAKYERKNISWVIETALADYFNCKITLRRCKNSLPEFGQVSNTKKRA